MKKIMIGVLIFLSAVSACAQVQTIRKKVGDEIAVKVSIATSEVHGFVGFDLQYPEALMEPKLLSGQSVEFSEGPVYSGLSFETLCSRGAGAIVVSKVLRTSGSVVSDGAVVTLLFSCKAAGSGTLQLQNQRIGYVGSGGTLQQYDTVAEALDLAIQVPAAVQFRIEVQ